MVEIFNLAFGASRLKPEPCTLGLDIQPRLKVLVSAWQLFMQNWLTKGGDAAVGVRGATVVQGGRDFVRFTFGEVQVKVYFGQVQPPSFTSCLPWVAPSRIITPQSSFEFLQQHSQEGHNVTKCLP